MRRWIYLSETHEPWGEEDLIALSNHSAARNLNAEITGHLHYRGSHFFQYIEGRSESLTSLIARLRNDPRHHILRELELEPDPSRLFPTWQMRYLQPHEMAHVGLEDVLQQVLKSLVTPVIDEDQGRRLVLNLCTRISARISTEVHEKSLMIESEYPY